MRPKPTTGCRDSEEEEDLALKAKRVGRSNTSVTKSTSPRLRYPLQG
jgi:hypothetical protein